MTFLMGPFGGVQNGGAANSNPVRLYNDEAAGKFSQVGPAHEFLNECIHAERPIASRSEKDDSRVTARRELPQVTEIHIQGQQNSASFSRCHSHFYV
jgi:hypothetical protein